MTTNPVGVGITAEATAQEDSEQSKPGLRTTVETIASNPDHVDMAQKLRFEVFNLELGEGLPDSKETGRDKDPFDDICDHILIWDDDLLVGTYRGQPGSRAAPYRRGRGCWR
jgi:putative hemolysin